MSHRSTGWHRSVVTYGPIDKICSRMNHYVDVAVYWTYNDERRVKITPLMILFSVVAGYSTKCYTIKIVRIYLKCSCHTIQTECESFYVGFNPRSIY